MQLEACLDFFISFSEIHRFDSGIPPLFHTPRKDDGSPERRAFHETAKGWRKDGLCIYAEYARGFKSLLSLQFSVDTYSWSYGNVKRSSILQGQRFDSNDRWFNIIAYERNSRMG